MYRSNQGEVDEFIYQKPVASKSPDFYQSSLFGIKHKSVSLRLNETVVFRIEVEISPETIRHLQTFDEIYEAVKEQIYINADLYTTRYDFEESSDDEEYLRDYDLSQLKKSNRAEYFIGDPFRCKLEYMCINFTDLYFSSCNGFVQCSLVKFVFNVNKMIDLPKQEEHMLRKYGTYDTTLIAKKLLEAQKEWSGSPHKRIQDYNKIIQEKLSPTKQPIAAESVEEFFFGDEHYGYKMTDDAFNFTKAFVQKLMLVLVNPLEDSYNTIKELFHDHIFFQGVRTKDLQDLNINPGAKNVDHLYQSKGYERAHLEGRQTLSRYKTKKLQQIYDESKDFSEEKSKFILGDENQLGEIINKNPFRHMSVKKTMSKPIDMKRLGSEERSATELVRK